MHLGSLIVFLLLLAGFSFLLGADRAWKERSQTRKKRRSYRSRGKLGVLAEKLSEKRRAVTETGGMPERVFVLLCLGSGVLGFFAGRIVYRSLFLSAATGIVSLFLPLLLLSLRSNRAVSTRLERLASSMMILSNSYLVTDDLITSVRDNLDILEVSEPFRDFLTYVTLMDSDIRAGLRRMEAQVNNPYFSQWTDALVLAQEDRSLKYVAVAVVDSMHDAISAQQDSDAAMAAVWRDYLLTLVLIFSVPLVFRVLMNEAYLTMTESLPGQAMLTLLLTAVVWSVFRAVKINRPLLK